MIMFTYSYIDLFKRHQNKFVFPTLHVLALGQFTYAIQFHREMKRTIGFVREQVENIKPFIETFKMARNFL